MSLKILLISMVSTCSLEPSIFAGDQKNICENFVLKLAGMDDPGAKPLSKARESADVFVSRAEGIAGRIIPFLDQPIVESKASENVTPPATSSEDLVAALLGGDPILDNGYFVERPTPEELRDENSNEIVARFVSTRPPSEKPNQAVPIVAASITPYEYPLFYDKAKDEVRLWRVFREGFIDGEFEKNQRLRYALKFEDLGENLRATLIVETADGKKHPFHAYEFSKELVQNDRSPALGYSNIRHSTFADSDRALREMTHFPKGFWFHLKIQTIDALKSASREWISHHPQRKAS